MYSIYVQQDYRISHNIYFHNGKDGTRKPVSLVLTRNHLSILFIIHRQNENTLLIIQN